MTTAKWILSVGVALFVQFGSAKSAVDSTGLYPFYSSTIGKFGYLDEKGAVVIEAKFDSASSFSDFSDNLARVQVNGLFGYINSSGAFAIQPRFKIAGEFHAGLALASEDGVYGKYGYIDNTGQFTSPPSFYFTESQIASIAAGDIRTALNERAYYSRSNVATVELKSWYKTKCGSSNCCMNLRALQRRSDRKVIYVWSEIYRGNDLDADCGGDTEGGVFIFHDPQLVDVTFSSTPSGADVFAIPYTVYDFNKGIEKSLDQLRPFAILNGKTPVPVMLYAQKISHRFL